MNSKETNSIKKYIDETTNPKIYCRYCHKELKSTESKILGCGRSCFKKHQKKEKKRTLIDT